MKIPRILLAAVVLACIATLGLKHRVWATERTTGTVPTCPTSASETTKGTMTVCSSIVDVITNVPLGGIATLVEVNLSTLPLLPGANQNQFGTGVTISVLDKNNNPTYAWIEVCFPDPGGSNYIYRWVTASEWKSWFNVNQVSSWVMFPTFHKAGVSCTHAWVPGTYAIP